MLPRFTWLLAAAVAGVIGTAQAIVPLPRPGPPPSPAPMGWTYQWIPPVYQTISDRFWVDTRVDWRTDWMEVSPGRWEQVYRQVVVPGHWESSTRRVLVSPGRWELVRIGPPIPTEPPPIGPPWPRPLVGNPPTVGVDGYGRTGGEDLGRYSPLYEWPSKQEK